MTLIKAISNTFCGGLFFEVGAEYEVSTDDAMRLVALGKAAIVEKKSQSAPVKKKPAKKKVEKK